MPSPHPSATGLLPSPRNASNGGATRPPLMKRHSSQQSHGSGRIGIISPSSASEHYQPLRHHVKPVNRKTKIVLPRNGNSNRNLAKLARHGSDQLEGKEGKRHTRQKSQDGEVGTAGSGEGIRLPGSLDESSRPAMKRNLTSSHLPRNTSHSKLKKNLSHGQLARIGSGRNLQALTAATGKGPPSPGLKGKGRKKKSLDAGYPEKDLDLHEQEVEIARQQQAAKEGPRRVGFAVGDGNDSSEEEDGLQMDGSGLQEDEWTDQSASASPATTRQNTANNSRRASVVADKPHDKQLSREAVHQPHYQLSQMQAQRQPQPQPPPPPVQPTVQQSAPEADGTPPESYDGDTEEDEEDPPSPRSMPTSHKAKEPATGPAISQPEPEPAPEAQPTATPKSLLHGAKDHPNPFTKQLLNRNNNNPAPALVSNVSAMDETRSARGSPAASMRSSRSNIADQPPDQEGELVSRFIPSASHPATSSGPNTTMNTPKTGSYQTPENEFTLAHRHRNEKPTTTSHPTSPGSTISGSSGATTPAMLRSRTELRMANERAMAEIEGSGKSHLLIPAHRFDRRNESLKSYLNIAALGGGDSNRARETGTGGMMPYGPEIFEGRFKAVNTELKVVQRFRDPLGECLGRLQRCEGGGRGRRFGELRGGKKGERRAGTERVAIASKSAVGLSSQGQGERFAEGAGAKSASPAKSAMLASRIAGNVSRGDAGGSEGRTGGGGSGRVKFSSSPPETREVERGSGRAGVGVGVGAGEEGLSGADAVARRLWDVASGKP